MWITLGLLGLSSALAVIEDPYKDVPRPGDKEDRARVFKLSREVFVHRWDGKKVITRRVSRADVFKNCPKCINLDGKNYYTNWGALARAPFVDQLAQGERVRLINQELVASCTERTGLADKGLVIGDFRQVCRNAHGNEGGLNAAADIFYRVSREYDGIHVGTKIRFKIFPDNGSRARAQRMMDVSRECIPMAREIWGRYGIIFDLDMDTADDPTPGEMFHTVELRDDTGRSNVNRFYFKHNAHVTYCKMVQHEIGHMLGLPDEYPDDECPDRPWVSKEKAPWSVMKDEYHELVDIDYYPRHIRTVLSPLCDKAGSSWAP